MVTEYRVVDGFSRDDIFHGFFTRKGGVSGGVYAGLNCGPGSGDERAHITENRARVAAAAGCAQENLLTLYQVHGNCCEIPTASYDPDNRPQADAHVTDRAGVALGILTADCTPVLFYGRKGDGAPVIGAAHAGWGGAIKGVLDESVAKMVGLGAMRESIVAAIGPCIAQDSYEVGVEFFEEFTHQNPDNAVFFKPGLNAGKKLFNLPAYCENRLRNLGINDVFVEGSDTYREAESFYSFRRTTHAGEPDYGRQISVVMIRVK